MKTSFLSITFQYFSSSLQYVQCFSASQNQKVQGFESDKISKVLKEWQEEFLKTHLLHCYLSDFVIIALVSSHRTYFVFYYFFFCNCIFVLLFCIQLQLFPLFSTFLFFILVSDTMGSKKWFSKKNVKTLLLQNLE